MESLASVGILDSTYYLNGNGGVDRLEEFLRVPISLRRPRQTPIRSLDTTFTYKY